jgi:hypothetical protein
VPCEAGRAKNCDLGANLRRNRAPWLGLRQLNGTAGGSGARGLWSSARRLLSANSCERSGDSGRSKRQAREPAHVRPAAGWTRRVPATPSRQRSPR